MVLQARSDFVNKAQKDSKESATVPFEPDFGSSWKANDNQKRYRE